jgi:ParB family chromosome partitioning protein
MSAIHRRGLRVDDPLSAGDAFRDEHSATSSVVGNVGVGGDRLRDIPLAQIHANPSQPRKRFDESALASLADSIRERGVLQPVIVRPDGNEYELVAGERRWRAAELAGEQTIPALVDGALDEAGSLELALIENVVREDLTAIEQARTLAVLLGDLRMTGAVVAKRLGRSRADIVNTVRLLDLPDEAVDLIDSGALTKGHGKALLTEPDHHRRRVLARRAAEGGWSVRALEADISCGAKPASSRPSPHPDQCAAAARLQDAIANATGGEARATPHRRGFQIILDQVGADRLARILGGEMTAL